MKRTPSLILVLAASLAFHTVAAGQQPRQATLAQQKMCADQARKTFEQQPLPEHIFIWDYTSHYDPRANVCYIMTHLVNAHGSDGHLDSSRDVFDAFENRTYAEFTRMHFDKVPSCVVMNKTVPCENDDDFLDIVEKKFGVGK